MIGARLAVIVALIGFLFPQIASPSPQESRLSPDRSEYVGDASCLPCHTKLGQSFQHTPHHLTSQIASANSVHGSFESGSNSLIIHDPAQSAEPGLQFVMEARKDGFFETARSGWGQDVFQRTERIDLVTGSGKRGQTYLYWDRDRLFELPVSYWSDGHRWINSPGYIDGTAKFSRAVIPACLECHATFVRVLSTDRETNRFDRQSLIPGISCESCHGPGAKHVQLEKLHEGKSNTPYDHEILNPAKFSRDRKVDLCAECHHGIQREALAPTFAYIPGRPLSDYFKPLVSPDVEHPDVHGNQVGLLQRSKCYRSSDKLSCTTCHDVHITGQPAESYSQKCQGCHNWQSCGMAKKMGHQIVNECINCHMPIEQTNLIVSQTAGQVVHATMRNHWIKVYENHRLPGSQGTTALPESHSSTR